MIRLILSWSPRNNSILSNRLRREKKLSRISKRNLISYDEAPKDNRSFWNGYGKYRKNKTPPKRGSFIVSPSVLLLFYASWSCASTSESLFEKLLEYGRISIDTWVESDSIEVNRRSSRDILLESFLTIEIDLFRILRVCETAIKFSEIRNSCTLGDESTLCIRDFLISLLELECIHRITELFIFSLFVRAECCICITKWILMGDRIERELLIDDDEFPSGSIRLEECLVCIMKCDTRRTLKITEDRDRVFSRSIRRVLDRHTRVREVEKWLISGLWCTTRQEYPWERNKKKKENTHTKK